jgi:Second Messenger Oligonucleotide or Dinucleotide Synthetase domain
MYETTESILSELLDGTADDLDIPMGLHDAAEKQYDQVGQFLADQSDLGVTSWDVYAQGSFRIGTVVRPLGQDHYDLDMVCRLDMAATSISQTGLKERVGNVLDAYLDAVHGTPGSPTDLEPSRRCWVLRYPEAFHLDVLPALPNEEDYPNGIRLTDTALTRWQFSNPIDFAEWFRKRGEKELLSKMAVLEKRKQLPPFPTIQVKTTLQRTVQIVKRHRDIFFNGDPDQPPSIVLSTLAALAYRGEQDLFSAIRETADTMVKFIEKVDGVWWLKNPVADENFTDKWNQYPERMEKFHRWRDQLNLDLEESTRAVGIDVVTARLSKSLGSSVFKAAGRMGDEYRETRERGALKATSAGLLGTAAGDTVRSHGFYGSS